MRKAIAILASTVVVLSACSSMDESQRKTAQTTGIGAAAGAAVGALAGGRSGAAIGAAVGGLGGYVWSQHMESQRKQIETATQGTGVEVMIPGDISFDPGRADIKPNFRPVLDQFAQSMVQNPGSVIQIIGHTDASGNDAANLQLSRQRANATRDYLASRGVAMNRMATDGRGEHEPLASNDTEAGRARNRRVEIFVQENPA
jgi:outer membrane protein OmpA-like peptidoglycan-associated protein